MTFTSQDIVPISEARARLTELSDEVVAGSEKLLTKKSWKAHYYFGKFGQKIGVPLKWILPQNFYENLMRKYNQMD